MTESKATSTGYRRKQECFQSSVLVSGSPRRLHTHRPLHVKCGHLCPFKAIIVCLSCTSRKGWRPDVHLINICCSEISQLAEWESLAREANLACGCKSSQLNAEDRMSFLITEMVREKKDFKFRKKTCDWESVQRFILVSLSLRARTKVKILRLRIMAAGTAWPNLNYERRRIFMRQGLSSAMCAKHR